MQTVDKALGLLGFFSEGRPTIGLSEIARLSGFNKATTRRLLLALEKHGFVEQDAKTRAYCLGPSLLRLARVREAVSPVQTVVRPILEDLVARIGETAHFSLPAGGSLATIGLVESTKSNRVMLERGEVIPLHATASGIAFMAFARPEIVDVALDTKLTRHTPHTITDTQDLRQQLRAVAKAGVAVAKSSYEDGVCGIAAPVLGEDGFARGAVAVALPVSRAKRTVIAAIQPEVRRAAAAITTAMGAEPHPSIARSQGAAAA
ncbi:MAG: IclR family transcriptional regulator [Proteobacteria bacterium]|nr:IclR family transcriptional regulator [Pseudomonadota bacterium]